MTCKLEIGKGGAELVIRIPTRMILEPLKKDGGLDIGSLTVRQRQVLKYLLAGKVAKEIASELNLSERTIRYHFSVIYAKTGLQRNELHRKFGTV